MSHAGSRVEGFGFRVEGFEVRVWSLGCWMQGGEEKMYANDKAILLELS